MRFLLALFIIIPISEMWLLIEVGGQIGGIYTVLLVFLTAAAGLALLRRQGLQTLMRLNQKVEQGQMPAGEIAEGVALAVGGALLLTPGFITDGIGFICLLPFTRKLFLGGLLKKILSQSASVHSYTAGFSHDSPANDPADGDAPVTLDGEYRREP